MIIVACLKLFVCAQSISIPFYFMRDFVHKNVWSCSGNIVLRVPLLYGQVETLAESAVTTLFDKVTTR